MKFGVLALDYDGTIARDGVLDPDVKAAIKEARGRGIVVIIVTGRILSELRKAVGDLDFVDAVVAENGAVLRISKWSIPADWSSPTSSLLRRTAAQRHRIQVGPVHCGSGCWCGSPDTGDNQEARITSCDVVQLQPPDGPSPGHQQGHWPARGTKHISSFGP